ncbi:MAG: hypothetical protein RL653_675, partial [Pseudomonadota bacterium]
GQSRDAWVPGTGTSTLKRRTTTGLPWIVSSLPGARPRASGAGARMRTGSATSTAAFRRLQGTWLFRDLPQPHGEEEAVGQLSHRHLAPTRLAAQRGRQRARCAVPRIDQPRVAPRRVAVHRPAEGRQGPAEICRELVVDCAFERTGFCIRGARPPRCALPRPPGLSEVRDLPCEREPSNVSFESHGWSQHPTDRLGRTERSATFHRRLGAMRPSQRVGDHCRRRCYDAL